MGETLKAEEVRRLLSEYAAGTISDSDRRILMAAALEDQALFDALAIEQPLADLMADPASRRELREAFEEERDQRGFAWWWKRLPMTTAATAMVAILAVLVTLYIPQSPLSPEIRSIARRTDVPQAPMPQAREEADAGKSVGGVLGTPAAGRMAAKEESKLSAPSAYVPASTQSSHQRNVPGSAGGIGAGVGFSKEEQEQSAARDAATTALILSAQEARKMEVKPEDKSARPGEIQGRVIGMAGGVPSPPASAPPGGAQVTIRSIQAEPARLQPADVSKAVAQAVPATPPAAAQSAMKGDAEPAKPGGVIAGIMAGAGAPPPPPPPPPKPRMRDRAATEVPGGVVGGVPGGVVGGVVGGVMPPPEKPKAVSEGAREPAVSDDAARLNKDLRLALSPATEWTWQLLLRDAVGLFREVPQDTILRAGDAARVRLQAPSAGYLAVAEQAENGTWRLIFPAEGTSAVRIDKQTFVTLPLDRAWEFGTAARDRKLIAVFTVEPQVPLIAPDGALRRPERGTLLDIILKAMP